MQALEETTGRGYEFCPGDLQKHLVGVSTVVLLQLQSKGTSKLIAASARLYDFTTVLQCVEEKEAPQYHKP